MKVMHSCFVKDEAHCIERMLNSILPYVDGSFLLIDDRTTDNTKEIADSMGCQTELFTFENFGKTKNLLYKRLQENGAAWTMGLAPDEIIEEDFGENIKWLINRINNSPVDGVYFARRHWLDLEMTDETNTTGPNKYPDWQQRLIRVDYPRIHCIRYVHEITVGVRKKIYIEDDIHHFNFYWKPILNIPREQTLAWYAELEAAERKEGGKNIWPK